MILLLSSLAKTPETHVLTVETHRHGFSLCRDWAQAECGETIEIVGVMLCLQSYLRLRSHQLILCNLAPMQDHDNWQHIGQVKL